MNNSSEITSAPNASKKLGGRERNLNYSPIEDLQLCKSGLKMSQNLVVGADQESATFWENIRVHFSENLEESRCKRNAKGLSTRWSRHIQSGVSKFCGYYEQVQNLGQSGQDEFAEVNK